jgi:hypothetical protein
MNRDTTGVSEAEPDAEAERRYLEVIDRIESLVDEHTLPPRMPRGMVAS